MLSRWIFMFTTGIVVFSFLTSLLAIQDDGWFDGVLIHTTVPRSSQFNWLDAPEESVSAGLSFNFAPLVHYNNGTIHMMTIVEDGDGTKMSRHSREISQFYSGHVASWLPTAAPIHLPSRPLQFGISNNNDRLAVALHTVANQTSQQFVNIYHLTAPEPFQKSLSLQGTLPLLALTISETTIAYSRQDDTCVFHIVNIATGEAASSCMRGAPATALQLAPGADCEILHIARAVPRTEFYFTAVAIRNQQWTARESPLYQNNITHSNTRNELSVSADGRYVALIGPRVSKSGYALIQADSDEVPDNAHKLRLSFNMHMGMLMSYMTLSDNGRTVVFVDEDGEVLSLRRDSLDRGDRWYASERFALPGHHTAKAAHAITFLEYQERLHLLTVHDEGDCSLYLVEDGRGSLFDEVFSLMSAKWRMILAMGMVFFVYGLNEIGHYKRRRMLVLQQQQQQQQLQQQQQQQQQPTQQSAQPQQDSHSPATDQPQEAAPGAHDSE